MKARAAAIACALLVVLAGCGSESDSATQSEASADTPPGPEPDAKALPEPELGSIALDDLHGCGDQPGREGYRCGSLRVPFEREDPSYGTTRIGFAVLPRTDMKAPSDGAIFAVEGGPGYPSTGTAEAYRKLFGPKLLEHREMVLVDQRGQGRSEQFPCSTLQRGLGPDDLVLADCARDLGPRYISYRTSAAADDIDWVRQALGYETIALYGDSYGTFLSQSYAYRHADKLDALVLDSAYPAYGEDPWYPSLPEHGVRSIEVACDRSARCDGDAGERLADAAQILREKNRTTLPLIAALINSAYSPPGSYLRLDKALQGVLRGDFEAYDELTDEGKLGSGSQDAYSRPGELVVSCNDYPMVWDKYSTEPERRDELDESIRTYPKADRLKPFTPREIAMSPGTSYLYCLTWPQPNALYEPPVDPETEDPTEAPTLVISNELDDVTTPEEGRRVAKRFPDSEFFLTPNRGHVSSLYFSNGPAATKIREFLAQALGG